MLHYAIVFLVIALIAAVLGFGGIAGAAAGIAKILFLVFLVLFIVSLFMGRRGRRRSDRIRTPKNEGPATRGPFFHVSRARRAPMPDTAGYRSNRRLPMLRLHRPATTRGSKISGCVASSASRKASGKPRKRANSSGNTSSWRTDSHFSSGRVSSSSRASGTRRKRHCSTRQSSS